MKLYTLLFAALAAFMIPGAGVAHAYPVQAASLVAGQLQSHACGKYDYEASSEKKDKDRKKRKVGAGMWGGPYWGYGPRLSDPCKDCLETCDENPEGKSCKRCKIRCGQ